MFLVDKNGNEMNRKPILVLAAKQDKIERKPDR